jgi:hypothetical protein
MAGVPLADIALGPDGKLLIVNGKLQLVLDHDARKQCLIIALQHFMGEFFRDQTAGTDWLGTMIGKQTDIARRAELRRRCLSVPGISDVQQMVFKMNRQTRHLDITVEAVATDGTVITASASLPVQGA